MNRVVGSVLQYSRCLQRHPPGRKGQGGLVRRCFTSSRGDQRALCARVQVVSTSHDSTAVLAAYFARQKCMPGDCYLLFGDVGAGKSYFRYGIGHCMYACMHVFIISISLISYMM